MRDVLSIVQSETHGSWTIDRAVTSAGVDIDVLVTGIGPSRAAEATEWAMARSRPIAVLSVGCAGALEASLEPGDVVIASEIHAEDGSSVVPDPGWRDRLQRAAERAGVRASTGGLVTSQRILASADGKRRIREATGAVAVEMEASAIAGAAQRAGVPFAAARAILDTADMEIEFARDLLAANGRLRAGALASALVRGRGSALRELRFLAAARRSCVQSLRRFLAALFVDIPRVAQESDLG